MGQSCLMKSNEPKTFWLSKELPVLFAHFFHDPFRVQHKYSTQSVIADNPSFAGPSHHMKTNKYIYTQTHNSYSHYCIYYACGFHSVRQSYVTLEEPQVVDEVAVPRLPTGEAKAQLPGVSAARCRCWCTMCSKQGNSGFVWAEVGGERKGCLPRHFRIDANLTHAWVLPTVYVTIPSSLTDWWKVLSFPFSSHAALWKEWRWAYVQPSRPSVSRSLQVILPEWCPGSRPL